MDGVGGGRPSVARRARGGGAAEAGPRPFEQRGRRGGDGRRSTVSAREEVPRRCQVGEAAGGVRAALRRYCPRRPGAVKRH